MKEFERVLEDCLHDLERGASNVDECLERHPKHAVQLRPILLIAARLEQGGEIQPSPAYKIRARAQLMAHMRAHPRRMPGISPFLRLAFSLAALVLAFLVTGTALAQSALPGEPLYNWKLASEMAWRALSPDPLRADLALADRRVAELVALAGDPRRSVRALEAYQEALSRLESEGDAEAQSRILLVLQTHQSLLKQAGLSVPELDAYVRDQTAPESMPTALSQPSSTPIIELPILDTAVPLRPTSTPIIELPVIGTAIPETPALPEIVPKVKIPNLPLPTIEIPPPIR
jgi:hypothetical protein